MKSVARFSVLLFLWPILALAGNHDSPSGLSDTTVLIIRHAEKPDEGRTLSPAGEQRARAYVDYFQNLTIDSQPFKPDSIFAAADSSGSQRPRLTLEPLAAALKLKLDSTFPNKEPARLVQELGSKSHGRQILICWHHGSVPELLQAFGADPAKILPKSKWPDTVFNWVVVLHFDHDGRVIPAQTKILTENLLPGNKT